MDGIQLTYEAVIKGVSGLHSLDPFTSTDPLISSCNQVYNHTPAIEADILSSFVTRNDVDTSDDKWNNTEQEFEGNIF